MPLLVARAGGGLLTFRSVGLTLRAAPASLRKGTPPESRVLQKFRIDQSRDQQS